MKSTKFILALIIVLGVGTALGVRTYLADRSSSSLENLELSNKIETVENHMDTLSQQLEKLIELNSLKKDTGDLSQLEQRLAELENQQSESNNRETEKQDPMQTLLDENPQQYFEQQAQVAEQQERFLDMAFEVEQVDATWSAGVSTAVETAFQKPELAAGGQLTSVDCRSTMCKLDILHTTDDPNELFLFENHLLIELADQLPSGQVRKIEGADGSRTVAILARKGMNLPDFSAASAGTAGFGSGGNTVSQ